MKKLVFALIFIFVLLVGYISYEFFFVYHYSSTIVRVNYKEEYNDKVPYVKYRGKIIKNIKIVGTVDTTKLGNYPVKFKIMSGKKIKKVIKGTIVVTDLEAPKLKLNGGKDIIIDFGSIFEEKGYKAVDNYDGDLTKKVRMTDNINYKKLGKYYIDYKVTDAHNNTNDLIRIVEIKDVSAPAIKLKRGKHSYDIKGNKIDINDFEAIDNYDGDVKSKVIVNGSVDINTEGIYPISYKVADSSGNETQLETTINVQEKNTSGIPVLMYHWFYDDTNGETYPGNDNYLSKTQFEEQLKYLVNNNYYFVTYDELVDYIDGKIDLPRKSIILTDDDAHETFFRIAVPLCEQYKVPITSFAITGYDTGWKDYLDSDIVDVESHTCWLHHNPCKGAQAGLIMCSSYERIEEDIRISLDMVQSKDAFAYPYGNYNNKAIDALKANGVKTAFTIDEGRVKVGANKYTLPRVRISKHMSIDDYARRIK